MHANDFREDLPVTRGQWRQIAEGFCRATGETPPSGRLEATELLLRLQAADPPSGTPEGTGAAQAGQEAPQNGSSAPAGGAGRITLGGRGARR